MFIATLKVYCSSKDVHLSPLKGKTGGLDPLFDGTGLVGKFYYAELQYVLHSVDANPSTDMEIVVENELYTRLAGRVADMITESRYNQHTSDSLGRYSVQSIPVEVRERHDEFRLDIIKRHSIMKIAQQESMWTYSSLLNLLYVEQMGLRGHDTATKKNVQEIHPSVHIVTIVELCADLVHLMFPEHGETRFLYNTSDIGRSFIADASKYLMRISKSVQAIASTPNVNLLSDDFKKLVGHYNTFTTISKEVRRLPAKGVAEIARAVEKVLPGAKLFVQIVAAVLKSEYKGFRGAEDASNLLNADVFQLSVAHGKLYYPGMTAPIPVAELWYIVAQHASNQFYGERSKFCS